MSANESSQVALREQIVAYGRRMHAMGFVAATDGNISCRAGDGSLLVTVSGVCLGDMDASDVVAVDSDGGVVSGAGPPTSELALHLAVYRARADVSAVIHAHPPAANAFSFAGVSMDDRVIPEVVLSLGSIPTTEYATPSSEEGALAIEPFIRDHDAVLLARHGSVTVGGSVRDAYLKLEKLEHAARTLLATRGLGPPRRLSHAELRGLLKVAKRRGWPLSALLRSYDD